MKNEEFCLCMTTKSITIFLYFHTVNCNFFIYKKKSYFCIVYQNHRRVESFIKLNVLGITFSQVQAGAYALILAEEGGQRRIPIIIGTPEAQSIAIFLEGLKPPRPLTHDMFISFMQEFDVKLEEIFIYKFEEGVFYSEIVFQGNNKTVRIDARTSDAIALAIRCGAPIITTEVIMKEAGVILEEEIMEEEKNIFTPESSQTTDTTSLSLEELKKNLEQAIGEEDYEKASKIRDEIKKRTENNPS